MLPNANRLTLFTQKGLGKPIHINFRKWNSYFYAFKCNLKELTTKSALSA